MISASKQQQALVLRLSELDLQLSRTRGALSATQSSSAVENLRSKSLEASEALLSASTGIERMEDEVAKTVADIALVDARISQDEAKAKTVSSERELKAIELELASLRSRKEALEESELDLLQNIENLGKELAEISRNRAAIASELEVELAKVGGQERSLSAQISEINSKRQDLVSEINPALFAAYENKAARGVPVGQTLGRDCSACRLAINGAQFDAMMALPEDSLPTCPNCDAFIIR